MSQLTENTIKRVALQFLKSHYRYRPRTGATTLSVNLRGEGGLIVDGHLTFPQEDEKMFVATVEATSYLTRDEVRYRVQRDLLTWDGLAVGSVLAAILFSVAHLRHLVSIPRMGGLAVWILVMAVVILLLHGVYRIMFFYLRRYRYIYAIEQFKRYHADEQWIAIGEDVFPSSEDRYFRELREQCIYHGFGLIIIDQQLRPRIHITPSRVDLFPDQRRDVEFFSLEELERRLRVPPLAGRWLDWRRYLPWVPRPQIQNPLLQFRRRYVHQIIITVSSLAVLASLFYLQMQDRPIEYVDESEYAEQMEQLKRSRPGREPQGYVIDSAFVPPYLPVTRGQPPNQLGPVLRRPGLIVYEGSQGFFEYDCERLYSGDAPRFVIALEVFDTDQPLRQLIRQLHGRGMEAMGLWLGCFSIREDDYVLFLRQLYATRPEAEADLPGLQEQINQKGLSARLEILSLMPPM